MKKTHFTPAFCSLLLGAAVGLPFPGQSASVIYTGSEDVLKTLHFSGRTHVESLFPEGSPAGNEVIAEGAGTFVSGWVTGNDPNAGEQVADNKVVVSGASVKGEVRGGFSDTGSVTNNTVHLSKADLDNQVLGGSSYEGDVVNNTVIISESSVAETIYGGYSMKNTEGSVMANTIRISEHSRISSSIYGGSSTATLTSHNTVTISESSVTGSVFGGFSSNGDVADNTVIISGGQVEGFVYGGYSHYGAASGNTVILKGAIQFSETSMIYGGDSFLGPVTGNMLALENFSGSVYDIQGIARVSMLLDALSAPGEEAPLLILNSGDRTLAGAILNIEITGGAQGLSPGDTVTLIRSAGSGNLVANGLALETSSISNVKGGMAMLYDVAFSVKEDRVDATLTAARLNPQTKSLAEGRIAPLALASQGQDLIATMGINNAALSAMHGGFTQRPEAFFAMSGGHSRYDTGSHLDLSGFSALVGLSAAMPQERSFVLGAFLETGHGNYTSHNAFENAASVRGSGDTSYCGGGMLARWDLAEAGLRGLALEASFRGGSVEADYFSGDLTDAAGCAARYKLSSLYYGGHAGATFSRSVTRSVSMSSYARFLWTRVEDERAVIAGDKVAFHTLESHRLQGGARFHYEAAPAIRPYAGLGYEWEFNGAARATTHGLNITAPSLRGGTGMAELGVVFQPVEGRPIFIDAGIKGYAGKRTGIAGSLQLRAAF